MDNHLLTYEVVHDYKSVAMSLYSPELHSAPFGPKDDRRTKFNPDAMRAIRRRIDGFIQQGTNHVPDRSL